MYLTRAEVAERLRVSQRTVDRLIKSGLLTAIKNPGPNGAVRIPETSLEQFVTRQALEPESA